MIEIDYATMQLPLCFRCQSLLPGEMDYPHAMPCVNCGRDLRHRYGHHFAEAFCSEQCQEIVYARRDQCDERRERRRHGLCLLWRGFHPEASW